MKDTKRKLLDKRRALMAQIGQTQGRISALERERAKYVKLRTSAVNEKDQLVRTIGQKQMGEQGIRLKRQELTDHELDRRYAEDRIAAITQEIAVDKSSQLKYYTRMFETANSNIQTLTNGIESLQKLKGGKKGAYEYLQVRRRESASALKRISRELKASYQELENLQSSLSDIEEQLEDAEIFQIVFDRTFENMLCNRG